MSGRLIGICLLLLGGVSLATCSILMARKQPGWKRPQFSLRALLIALTIVAVVLGFVVYTVAN